MSDQLIHPSTQVAEYADDKVIYTTNTDPKLASGSIQNYLNLLSPQNLHWVIKKTNLNQFTQLLPSNNNYHHLFCSKINSSLT